MTPRSWVSRRHVCDDLTRLYDLKPQAVACDSHPDYLSARHAAAAGLPWFGSSTTTPCPGLYGGERALRTRPGRLLGWDGLRTRSDSLGRRVSRISTRDLNASPTCAPSFSRRRSSHQGAASDGDRPALRDAG